MKLRVTTLLILACLPLAACPGAPPPNTRAAVNVPQDAYVHDPSSMVFPSTVDNFRRVGVTRYDATGLDISVGYNLESAQTPIAVTVYIYPAPSLTSIGSPANVVAEARAGLCDQEFALRKRELVSVRSGARLVEEKKIAAPSGFAAVPGRVAVYEYDDQFAGRYQALTSVLRVHCYVGNRWIVKYRISWPRSVDGQPLVDNFIAHLRWTIPQER